MTIKVNKKHIGEMAESIQILSRWLNMLRPIKSEADLNEAVENLASFMDLDAEAGSREGNMLETLAILIVNYKKRPRPKGDDAAEIEAREIIEGLAYQFGFRGVKDGATSLGTAGHSDLERAFAFLGWSDPQPIPEEGCEAEGCVEPATCGTPTPEGYRRLCRSHALANRSRDRGK